MPKIFFKIDFKIFISNSFLKKTQLKFKEMEPKFKIKTPILCLCMKKIESALLR